MIRCSTKPEKFKNLTLDKEYDATDDGEMYVLTNDAGLQSKYAKKYFTTVVRSVPISEALNVTTTISSEDEVSWQLQIGRHRAVNLIISINNTSISCGVEELYGISVIKAECTNLYNRLDHNLYTGTKEDIFEKVMATIMSDLRDSIKGCYIMSDAIRVSEEGYNTILNNMSVTRWQGINQNSDNEIILWVFE
jgi:hypothetical protein